jgi:hypothetical protein
MPSRSVVQWSSILRVNEFTEFEYEQYEQTAVINYYARHGNQYERRTTAYSG